MIPNNRRSRFYVWAILGLCVCSCVAVLGFWYKPGSLVLFWDQTYALRPALSIQNAMLAWSPSHPFGSLSTTVKAIIPLFALEYVLRTIVHSQVLAQAVLFAFVLSSSLVGWFLAFRIVVDNTIRGRNLRSSSVVVGSICGAMLVVCGPYAIFYSWRIVSTSIFLTDGLVVGHVYYGDISEE